jgi:hypothetical protein
VEENGRPNINPNVWLAEYARLLGLPKKELLVLAPNNDPFNCGTPAQVEAAKWFAGVYEQVGYPGIHLRRLHYRAYDEGLLTASGEEYPNTEKQWIDLQNASRFARYLGLVDPGDFVDMRAPTPHLSVSGLPYTPEPTYSVEPSRRLLDWYLPRISTDLSGHLNIDAEHHIEGYYYDDGMQPNLIEVWSEKSGDDATLVPLAQRFGINYCPGVGFQSVTNIRRMFQRVRNTEKPGRILYISDFDPAGMGMPVQVGRQTQYAIWSLEEIAKEEAPNVKLEHIALSQEQVINWQLPRKPIKDEDLRKGTWEDRFGEGAVEIDALEARYPGRLGRIVNRWVKTLQDSDLDQRIDEAREEAEERVADAVQEVIEHHRAEAQETVEEFNAIAERYREPLEALSAEFEEEVGPLRERFAEQEEAFVSDLEELDIELPALPVGEPPDETGDWMLDSDRDFVDQTLEFQRRQKRR